MRSLYLAVGCRMVLPSKVMIVLAVFSTALGISNLRAQDNVVPPPPENSAQMVTPDAPPMAPSVDQGADQPTGAVNPDQATDEGVTFQTFYDNLINNGIWIQTNEYGYVFQPTVNDPNWAPYTAGHWVYSDAGWVWVSDEPWGWATYHYGRWVNLQGTGWVWVPGYTWAPAWVSWRYGDGVAGWAPLPPESFVGVDYAATDDSAAVTPTTTMDVGYHIGGDVDSYYGIGPAYYIFIPISYICYHDYRGHYCDRHDNFWRINRTNNVTNINVNRNRIGRNPTNLAESRSPGGQFHHVTTGGPKLEEVNAASQTPVPKVTLTHTNQPGVGTVNNNTLALYAPKVGAGGTAKPTRVGSTLTQSQVNRGVDIAQPLAVNGHLFPTAATQAQIEQAKTAQSQAPANAKVLTNNGTFQSSLQAPVTKLKPMVTQPKTQTFNANPNAAPNTANAPQHGQMIYSQTPKTFQQPGAQQGNGAQAPVYNQGQVYQQQNNGVVPQQQQQQPPHNTPAGGTVFNPYVQKKVMPENPPPAQTQNNGAVTGEATQPGTFQRQVTPQATTPAPTHSAPVVRESAPASSGGGSRAPQQQQQQQSQSSGGSSQSSGGYNQPGQSSGGSTGGTGGSTTGGSGGAGNPYSRGH